MHTKQYFLLFVQFITQNIFNIQMLKIYKVSVITWMNNVLIYILKYSIIDEWCIRMRNNFIPLFMDIFLLCRQERKHSHTFEIHIGSRTTPMRQVEINVETQSTKERKPMSHPRKAGRNFVTRISQDRWLTVSLEDFLGRSFKTCIIS